VNCITFAFKPATAVNRSSQYASAVTPPLPNWQWAGASPSNTVWQGDNALCPHLPETDMNKLSTTILVAALAAGAQLAHADTAIDAAPQAKVRFADLDLDRVEGAAALYDRLHAAAQSVCGPLANDLANLSRYKACITETVSVAVARIDKPTLTRYARTQLDGHNALLSRIVQRSLRGSLTETSNTGIAGG
jgi:UrcA family protein